MQIFGKFDLFCRRLTKLIDMFTTIDQFTVLSENKLEGMEPLVEEFSGKPFAYDEILPVFEDYVPDPQAADVSPATRALADVCLLLFNSNEFVYLY